MVDLRQGIIETANAIGMDPQWLATIISYESGFNPDIWGGKGGQHYGLIQFGPAERAAYGVRVGDPSSQLGANGAIARYFLDRGWKPGMSFQDAYSTVNAGSPGRGGASDAAAGGQPGTVADKVVSPNMRAHADKATGYMSGTTALRHVGGAGSSPANFEYSAAPPATTPTNAEQPLLPEPADSKPVDLLTDDQIAASYGGGKNARPQDLMADPGDMSSSPLAEVFAKATPETPLFNPQAAAPALMAPSQVDLSQGLAEVFKLKPIGQAGIDPRTGLPSPRRRTYG